MNEENDLGGADVSHHDDEESEDYVLYLDGAHAAHQGEFEKAYDLLLRSAELNPHFKTYEYLYLVLKALGRIEEAFPYLQDAYHLNPRNNKTATLYAKALISQGKADEARSVLYQVLDRSATYGPARKLLEQIVG